MRKRPPLPFLVAARVTGGLQIVLFLLTCTTGNAMIFQKDDQVVLTRDEPLRLYQEVKATGTKGEMFSVLAAAPTEHRVYVAYKDAAGKSSALNIDESAILLLPGRGETAFRQGLAALKSGQWVDASRDLPVPLPWSQTKVCTATQKCAWTTSFAA